MAGPNDRIIAALDVGSAKTACLVARVDATGVITVLGSGTRFSPGVRAGAVVDMEATEHAIRAAVDQAERMAAVPVEDVYVSLNAGQPGSHIVEVDVAIDGHAVDASDIDKVLERAHAQITPSERVTVHALPACYAIDDSFGVKDPVGMYGDRLSVALHVLTAQPGPVRNLEACVQRAHLNLLAPIIAPHASGLATLVEDEMDLGVACIDMGGGTTSVSVFAKGALIYADVIPIGGNEVTEDIARGLLTPTEHAERLKTLFGAAMTSCADDYETIDVPRMGESDNNLDAFTRVPRRHLAALIQPRLEEIFEAVSQSLRSSGFNGVSGRGVVLTGGAAQMTGMRDLAEAMLNKQVRMGRPRGLRGLADATSGPAFSTCVGLLRYAAQDEPATIHKPEPLHDATGLSRVGEWFRQNF